jgi:membrane-bound lytic murein transglycosylase B
MSQNIFKKALLASLLVLFSACTMSTAATTSTHYDSNPEVQAFIGEMVVRHGFNRDELVGLFSQAERREDILELMRKPAEKTKPWYEYRNIFLTQSRIEGGTAFWKRNAGILDRAAASLGVDPQIIVAIIGVETRYGENTGRHRVLDALSTLAFDYPPRAKFFRRELEQYLVLSREEAIDPLGTKGSYAGAMGYGQFIPSSYRAYSVDFDNDGKRDLWNSQDDIIGSVANYFHRHGWIPGGPVAVPATVNGNKHQQILELGYKPNTVLDAMRHNGITPASPIPGDLTGALLSFEMQDGPEYWIGFNNFYVITRYNHSPLYAMAVYQLSEEIRESYAQNLQLSYE